MSVIERRTNGTRIHSSTHFRDSRRNWSATLFGEKNCRLKTFKDITFCGRGPRRCDSDCCWVAPRWSNPYGISYWDWLLSFPGHYRNRRSQTSIRYKRMPITQGGLINYWHAWRNYHAQQGTRVRDERLVFYSLAVWQKQLIGLFMLLHHARGLLFLDACDCSNVPATLIRLNTGERALFILCCHNGKNSHRWWQQHGSGQHC